LPQETGNRGLTPPANFGQCLRDSGTGRMLEGYRLEKRDTCHRMKW
jgi:hypothetical protein